MKQEVTRVLFAISISAAYCCIFPDNLQGETWYTHIRENTRTAIYFRESTLEHQQEETDLNYISDEWESQCIKMVDVNKYIISHANGTYACIAFVLRSYSVIQLMHSDTSVKYSSFLCEERQLKMDPWLLVSFTRSRTEFTVCPFSGGYNMKIKDKVQVDHPCNFMDLPMRFEIECLTGEGAIFDFRTHHCISDLPMNQVQRALCVTSWRQDGDVLTVLRNPDTDALWCLRIPARGSFDGKTRMILYTDLTCKDEANTMYFTLELELVSQHSLCMDEHSGCERLPCTDYFESQCLKSCGKCDPNVYPTSCDFPRKIRGEWYLNDVHGKASANISGSRLLYDRVGTFNCITFPNSPPSRKTKQFTTVSFFNNGCRPRYTCAAFNRMNANVYGIALSQSKVWPLRKGHDDVWSEICDTDNFHGDPTPIRDSFRTFNDVFKPMISKPETITRQPCPINASYIFNATFSTGRTCRGSLYKFCNQPSVMHFQFENCPIAEHQSQDFACIGTVDSKYWEHIILLQSQLNSHDTFCLAKSDIEPGRFIFLPSGECDQFTWTYVNVGLRTAKLDILVTPENHSCRSLATPTVVSVLTTTVSSAQALQPLNDAFKSDMYSQSAKIAGNRNIKTTHKVRHINKDEHTPTPSYPYKVIQTDSAGDLFQPSDSGNNLSSAANIYSLRHISSIIFIIQTLKLI